MTTDIAALSSAFADLAAGAGARVVSVRAERRWPTSGLLWSEGYVVTSEEMLAGDGDIAIHLPDGRTVTAELLGRDPSTDVALLKAETGPVTPWSHAPTPAVGSLVLGIGRGDTSPIAAVGLVGETGPAWTSLHGGRIDARIDLALRLPGRAVGGAIVAPDGGLVGMAVAAPRRKILAIPGSTIARAVKSLTEKGYVARGFLGLNLQPLHRRGASGGIVVAEVEADSPAARAGFVIGDIITTWGGEPLGGVGDIARRLGTESVGAVVTLGGLRGGEPVERTVTVGERPLARATERRAG